MALIGISGYAGSGKDCIGKMIQILISKAEPISIEEVINNYEDYQWWLEEQSMWEIRKYAGKLKEIASLLIGIPVEKFEDQEFKNTSLGSEWSGYTVIRKETPSTEEKIYKTYATYKEAEGFIFGTCKKYPNVYSKDSFYITEEPLLVREFLQRLGTNALRDHLHPNAWVNALFADYNSKVDDWIITDVRFPNEAKAIKDRDGIIIRVDRPGVKPVNKHQSETALDDYQFDYKIGNVSDLVSLMFTVETILKKEKLLL